MPVLQHFLLEMSRQELIKCRNAAISCCFERYYLAAAVVVYRTLRGLDLRSVSCCQHVSSGIKVSGHSMTLIHGGIIIMNLVQISPTDGTSSRCNFHTFRSNSYRKQKLFPIEKNIYDVLQQMHLTIPNICLQVSIRMNQLVSFIAIILLNKN